MCSFHKQLPKGAFSVVQTGLDGPNRDFKDDGNLRNREILKKEERQCFTVSNRELTEGHVDHSRIFGCKFNIGCADSVVVCRRQSLFDQVPLPEVLHGVVVGNPVEESRKRTRIDQRVQISENRQPGLLVDVPCVCLRIDQTAKVVE